MTQDMSWRLPLPTSRRLDNRWRSAPSPASWHSWSLDLWGRTTTWWQSQPCRSRQRRISSEQTVVIPASFALRLEDHFARLQKDLERDFLAMIDFKHPQV